MFLNGFYNSLLIWFIRYICKLKFIISKRCSYSFTYTNKFNSTFGGKSPGNSGASKAAKGSFKYIFILAFIVWLATGIYIVDPAERGVVLRFGAFQTSATQGPHWHIPYPIESVYKINVEQIRSAEICFRNEIGRAHV